MEAHKKYDAVILGGGLAGLTLALQLKQAKPALRVLVLEKRADGAPVATHKVGESSSELGSSYLRDALNLKAYLTEHQLPKFGFRFFFSPEHSGDISRRVEVGSKFTNPFPTHQVDRGLLENELVRRLGVAGVEVLLGATVKDVDLFKTGHKIYFEQTGRAYTVTGNWVVDSTGRSSLLKRKLGLEKKLDHNINAAWFRLETEIDIDDWSDNPTWRHYLDPGRRRLATNHLMGEGYWVWIIPLVSGSTSIGIVADPVFHPFDTFNTFDKAMQWLEKHEPLAAEMLGKHQEKRMDFKLMKNFAYDSKQFFSSDKWALTGEAGAFMDAFYSPGTDFIGLSNSWITDLIVRDSDGENISKHALIYDHAHKELLSGWSLLYKNMYGLFGKTQIMMMKILWDWASYWSVPNVLFMNNGYTDLGVLRQYSYSANSIGRKFAALNERMQELFRAWGEHDIPPCADARLNVFDLNCLHQFQSELVQRYQPAALMAKVAENVAVLEQISAAIFQVVSAKIHGTPWDMKVDPYTMSLGDGRTELLLKSNNPEALGVDESIRADVSKMWLDKNTVSAKMHYIQKLFLRVPEMTQDARDLDSLIELLDKEPPEFRSIAYESASMEIGLQALSNGKDLKVWKRFYHRAKKVHGFHLDIGLGWAFAKTETSPTLFLESMNPVIKWMVYDGIGYYYGLFKGRRTIKNQWVPEDIDADARHGFDQGLGRRLWYHCKGEVDELMCLIQPFPVERHPDLWRGVGIACGYVGGIKGGVLEKMVTCSANSIQQLRTGIALAAISRQASNSITDDVAAACQVVCNKPLKDVIDLQRAIGGELGPDLERVHHFWIGQLEATFA